MPTCVRIRARPSRLGVGLLRRLRAIERFELHAFLEDAHQGRVRLRIAVESLGIEYLRDEAAVGHRRRVTVAKAPAAGKMRETGFHLREPVRDPVAIPGV